MALSLIASVQVPFGVENNDAKLVVVGVKPVGGFAGLKSAAKVPVNGAEPVANDVAEAELITVFVKLSPEPPRALIRFCARSAISG
ncbi:MAG: hypothetical protein IPP73_01005 [Chitinophagaceae bacterium]|nr:hypothetical protein [Chitinophagaceae bacterium]